MIDQLILKQYADQIAAQDHSGHADDHLARVVLNAQRLLADVPQADAQIVLAAAQLHDSYDDKLVKDVAGAKQQTQTALKRAGASAQQQQAILTIIDHMGFKANLAQHQVLSIEGQLVQDADRLDALGAIGIGRTFMYGGAHGSRMYAADMPVRWQLDAAAYRDDESTVINHFYEKLFKLAEQMNTPAGRRIAAQRTAVMQDFVREFLAEWQGEK
ncbi:HD domain-containing protein [Lacticaseibacillus baoqingensis]|uniref:HD domain-containing protein n=1 Tax=Lacticaseibacillus baoqingensis TaxID=2486013 RepID=A0ABW4E388_9LACO|nr:HD domain-containing protein [Lacticaseibacillus baoqingensis]